MVTIGRFQFTRIAASETLYEGRYIEYLDAYSPAATSSRNKTITHDEGEKTGSTAPFGVPRLELAEDSERFWRLSSDAITIGGDGLIEVGGMFSGGIVADIVLQADGALLTKRKAFASVKFNGKSVKSVSVRPDESFQVGDTTFVFKMV